MNASIKGVNQNPNAVPVPVPIYCQPLAETSPGMKIWCAAGVNLMGGYTKDGGLMVCKSIILLTNTIQQTSFVIILWNRIIPSSCSYC